MRSSHRLLFSFVSVFLTLSAWAGAATYYVDATHGDDAEAGTSPDHAWRGLDKANSVELKPGDQLLFKAGEKWKGRLKPLGSGSVAAVASIGRYGDGPVPRIDGEGALGAAVLLENNSFLEVSDLEITNQGPTPAPRRTGVTISATGNQEVDGVHLQRLFVHDVNGDLRKSQEGCGIFFEAAADGSFFNGLIIENCHIVKTDRNGLCQRGRGKVRSRNIIIRGNLLEDIGGDGIKLSGTNGGLIEKNIVRKARARCSDAAAGIWPFNCDDSVIQFNEVSDTIGTVDGEAYDSDWGCHRTIFQYNYSYRNEGGFMLVCSPGFGVNDDTIIRYNVSVHDGINSARVFNFGGAPRHTRIYNNTVIIGPDQDLLMLRFHEWDHGKPQDTVFSNNLFIVEEGGRATYDFGPSSGNVFQNNIFAGHHEGLPPAVTVSKMPTLAGPLKPAPGFDSLKAFRPRERLSAPQGVLIEHNGGKDILGNPVSDVAPPFIGAVVPAP